MTTSNLIDVVKLVELQTKEQYRSILILGEPESGKTKFARSLAHKIHAKYIDLMNIFLEDNNLADTIDIFGVSSLKKYLLNLTTDEDVIIVDNIDFLLNTWSDREKKEFLILIEKLRSNETKKTFCFFAQESKILGSKQIYNSQNLSRIMTINQIAYIKEDNP